MYHRALAHDLWAGKQGGEKFTLRLEADPESEVINASSSDSDDDANDDDDDDDEDGPRGQPPAPPTGLCLRVEIHMPELMETVPRRCNGANYVPHMLDVKYPHHTTNCIFGKKTLLRTTQFFFWGGVMIHKLQHLLFRIPAFAQSHVPADALTHFFNNG